MRIRIRQAILALIPLGLLLAGALPFFMSSPGQAGPSERTPADIEKILDDVSRKYGQEVSHPRCLVGRQEGAWALFLKGRMLALVYPDIMEGLLISRVTDPSFDPHGRMYCMRLLGELSKSGRQAADVTIQTLAASPDQSISSQALWVLSETDLQGEHRALFRSKCAQGVWMAFDAIAFWNDPATVQEMKRIVAACPGNQYQESSLRLRALEVLEKLRILDSPDGNVQLEKILSEPCFLDHQFGWALQVAKTRRLPGLLDILRRRLDRTENPLAADASPGERRDFEEIERLGGKTSTRLAQGRSPGLQDPRFDDALIAYAELGGTLNEIERERLYRFGYWGDVRKRLEELLTTPDADN